MKQDVKLTIRGEQTLDTGETDCTECFAEGTLTATDYGYLLTYEESDLTGMEGTQTALQIRSRAVVLRRSGAFRAQMVYELGKQHTSAYQTPYGAMRLVLHTHALENSITAEGGTLQIDYSLEIDRQMTSCNRLHITVCPIVGANESLPKKQ